MDDTAAKKYVRTPYGSGWSDGASTALRLLLGIPTDGAKPFEGFVAPAIRHWAREALEIMAADGVERAVSGLRLLAEKEESAR